MKKNINENAQKEMQKGLEAYKKDKNSAKEFYPTTQAISLWLQEREK
jgi:hypothetical protein